MPVVPKDTRLSQLRALGVAEQLIEVAAGTRTHPWLWYRCLAPPELCYLGGALPPVGPPFIPLWESRGGSVTGVWSLLDGCEFLRFNVEAPEEPDFLARTEQGLWATLFVGLYFRPLADLLGFAHLDRVLDHYEATDHETFAAHHDSMKTLVAAVDALPPPR